MKKSHDYFKSMIKEALNERPPLDRPVDIEKKRPVQKNPVNVKDDIGPSIDHLKNDEEIPIGSSLTTRGDKMKEELKVETMIRREVRNLLDDLLPSPKKIKENVAKLVRKFNLSKEDARIMLEHPQIMEETPRFKNFLGKR